MGKNARLKRERMQDRAVLGHRNIFDEILMASITLEPTQRSIGHDMIRDVAHEAPSIVVIKSHVANHILDHWRSDSGTVDSLYDSFCEMPRPPFDQMFFVLDPMPSIKHRIKQVGAYVLAHKDDEITAFQILVCWLKDENLIFPVVKTDITLDESGCYSHSTQDHLEGVATESQFAMTRFVVSQVLYTLSLMNCRNIDSVETSPDPHMSEVHEQRYGIPLTKFRTLRIKSIGKHTTDNETKEYQDLMPLHLRRGNFATYTDDAPLFGKFTGTFWRPATVVGSEKNGVVHKDYWITANIRAGSK